MRVSLQNCGLLEIFHSSHCQRKQRMVDLPLCYAFNPFVRGRLSSAEPPHVFSVNYAFWVQNGMTGLPLSFLISW